MARAHITEVLANFSISVRNIDTGEHACLAIVLIFCSDCICLHCAKPLGGVFARLIITRANCCENQGCVCCEPHQVFSKSRAHCSNNFRELLFPRLR